MGLSSETSYDENGGHKSGIQLPAADSESLL